MKNTIQILFEDQSILDNFSVPPSDWVTEADAEDGEYQVVDRNNDSNYKVCDYPPIDVGDSFGEFYVIDVNIKKLDNGLIVWEITLNNTQASKWVITLAV